HVRLLLDLVPELLVEQRPLSRSRSVAAVLSVDHRQPRRGDRRTARQSRRPVPPLPLPHHHELREGLPQGAQSCPGDRGNQEADGRTAGVTLLRKLSADFDPAVVGEIDSALSGIVDREKVAMLLAVESGSRAWGFPSPDSDYDCRFIYARRQMDYVQLHQPRDVIELPLGAVLDINGWDIIKALRLLLKGN